MRLASFIRGRLLVEWRLDLNEFWVGVRRERYWGALEVTVCLVPGCVVWVHWRRGEG